MSESSLMIALLGAPQIKYELNQLKALRTQKAHGLLYYLITESMGYTARKFSREKLADLFWPDIGQSSALENLRQAIYQVRKAIPEVDHSAGGTFVPLLDSVHKGLMIHSDAAIQTDLKIFQESLRPWKSMDQKEKALSLYRGDFLGDFFLVDCPDFDL